jgi:uncharacterized membrane protein YbhN (UPF0104 family)
VKQTLGRILLFGGGLGLTVWLIRSAGIGHVLEALRDAGPWLPAVLLLELGILACDMTAARVLLGQSLARVGASRWVRSVALAYASTVILPAGRAAGEAVRATTLAPSIGLGRATAVCSRIQACVLVSNAAISFVIAAAVFGAGLSGALALAVLGNAVACTLLSIVVFAAARSERVAGWLRQRFKHVARPPEITAASSSIADDMKGALPCLLGRVFEATQYGVVLHAIGGRATPFTALAAQGIHLVGASVGDLVPNQMGVTEGAYRLFTSALGVTDARALSIALIIRIVQLSLTGLCFIVAAAMVREARSADAG